MTTEDYKKVLPSLPKQPGIYKFIGTNDRVLYVGKAKNLKNRIASYFGNKKHQLAKTRALVKNADHISFTIVETEQDSLLLESALIKKYQPRYNVMLKDGKTYSYICIKNERFPRVEMVRKVIKDGSTYFGPYTSKARAEILLELIQQLFPLRSCTYNLSEENINNQKFKVCLAYHIKNCMGPCADLETEEAYQQKIEQIKNMLRGHFGAVKRHFKDEMIRYAEQMAFEKAQQIKVKLAVFENYQGKSTVVSTTIKDVDVFSIAGDEKMAYVNYLKVVNGAIIHTYTQEMTKNLNDDETELLAYSIINLRERFSSITQELIVPFLMAMPDENLTLTIPKIGDKRKLLDLSEKNVKYYMLQQQKQAIAHQQKKTAAERILRTLQEDLQMNDLPLHIECFDNSNIQGTHPVASCVVFRNAKPAKRDYRHYNIKTVVGPDDFASMEEVVYRRYKRLLNEGQSLPQLVVIDGGKGQLHSAVVSLKALDLLEKVTVIGIAKKLEEIFFPGDSVPLYLNKKSESLKLIQQCRNEAHRFAITFHRNQRSRNFTTTELTNIEGIGDKTAQKLLTHFGSVKKIIAAEQNTLESVISKSAAKKIRTYFRKKDGLG